MSDLPNPINRYEKYLNAIATGNSDDLPTPTTREEVFLDYIAKNGGGGDIPTKTSDLINDSGFITNLVNNLLNYYLKTETYSKTEVDTLLQAITTLDIQAVNTLPTTNISTTTIYLVPKQDSQIPDVKDEYINLDGTTSGWELIGNTQIDLSNYVTTSDLTTALQSYATKAYVNGLIGNLSAATTTDKSSVVAMVNEVNGFFANLGSFTVNDLNTFFKSSVIAFHQLNPIAYRGYSVVTDWAYNGRFTGFFTDYTDSVDFVIAGGDNKRIFCGRYLIQADVLEVRTYMNSDKEQTLVNLKSTYDAGTDWNIVKQGNICVMNMRNLKDIPTGNTVIGTIPVDFRPESSFYEYVYSPNKNINVGFSIYDNGDVQILNPTGAAISGTVYVNRNVTYFTA